jgi:predicted DNA-binding transcriptional regulator AlpA
MPAEDDFVDVRFCYERLKIGRRQMYEMLREGRGPPHRKFGNRYRILYKNFLKWATTPERKRNGHA